VDSDSTPIVASESYVKVSSTSRLMMAVFPTPLEPTMIILELGIADIASLNGRSPSQKVCDRRIEREQSNQISCCFVFFAFSANHQDSCTGGPRQRVLRERKTLEILRISDI
jgi:hypothetical protein